MRRRIASIRWLVLATVLSALSAGCDNPPTQPPPAPARLALQCPTSMEVTARDGVSAEVAYGLQLSGGAPGASVTCTPPSGSALSIGEFDVNCTASDSAGQSASCSFGVRVIPPPRLRYSRFLAFGDSITEGQVSPAPTMLMRLGTPEAYPGLLQTALAERYTAQDIVVINRGYGGEELIEGLERLADVIDEDLPEVLLLQEGVNGIVRFPTEELSSAFRSMVRIAQRRGVTVLPALLLPVSPAREARRPGTQQAIRDFNREIRQISLELGCGEPVDLHTLFLENPGLLGEDGLHPTEEGYVRMAALFFEAIRSRWEEVPVPAEPVTSTLSGPRSAR